MRKAIFTSITSIILTTVTFSNVIEKYDPTKNSFIYVDNTEESLPSNIFIMNLKEIMTKEDPLYKNIKRGIRKYEEKKESISALKYKYNTGIKAENGIKINEEVYLVNNPNNFYFAGSVLAALIIAPLISDVSDIFDWISGEEDENDDPFYDADEEEERQNKRDENIKQIGRYTFFPGLAIIAIGYYGSKITLAQKEKIINEDDLIMPKLFEFFKMNEIDMAIKIYNSKIKI